MLTRIRPALAATAAALALGLGGAVAATSAAAASPAAIGRCSTASLSVWVNLSQGSVAAGTTSWPLDFTNTGRRPCTLDGYPGVVAATANGGQLGRAADHWPVAHAATVTIAAGGTAHALLFWLDAMNFPAGCQLTTASLIKVTPPGQRSAADAFFSLPVCRSTKPLYQDLFVSVVEPGAGRAR